MTKGPGQENSEPLVGTPGELLQKAVWHFNEGEFPVASAICQGIVANNPDNAEALHILGHIAMRTDEAKAAITHFMHAIRLAPTNSKFSRSFAECLENSGHTRQAILAWSQYVILVPDDCSAIRHIAELQFRAGHYSDAADTLLKAIALSPDDATIRYRCGVALFQAGDPAAAVEHYETALQIAPPGQGASEYRNALSVALRACGRVNDAVKQARLAIEMAPLLASAHNNLGLALLDAGDPAASIVALKQAVALRPEDPEILNNLGVVLSQSGDHPAAEERFREALRIRPNWAEGHLNLANSLREEERLDEAISHYREALVSAPDDFRILGSLALAQQNLNRPENAIASYERALELAPENPELLKGLGIVQLLSGDFDNGWRHYEWRRSCHDVQKRDYNCPAWDGMDIHDGTLLVHAEQGFGDTLQFCRYLPLLSGHVDNVIFECQPPLKELIGSLSDGLEIIAHGEDLPPANAHVALMSLPGIFGTTLETIPNTVPYLSASPEKISDWTRRFADDGRPNAGIVWAGNPLRQDDRMRSCPLKEMKPLLRRTDINFFSLQMAASDHDAELLRQSNVPDMSGYISSFSDTAAAVAACDLIISVDTATAHLAGALGKPVWVLLGRAADWRYLLNRHDSPWYPTMRLFRQNRHGDWGELLSRVDHHLSETTFP